MYFRFSNFDFSVFNFEVRFFSLLQGISKYACISNECIGMIFLFYEHCLSQVSSECHFLLLKRKFSYDSPIKTANVSIYFFKRFKILQL